MDVLYALVSGMHRHKGSQRSRMEQTASSTRLYTHVLCGMEELSRIPRVCLPNHGVGA